MKVSVQHWRFDSGEPDKQIFGHPDSVPRGWYCWVYTNDTNSYIDWMKENCPSADTTPRFNSGNPMVQTFIKDDREAAWFALNFIKS